jgi:DNA-nicking Smr family endonuclease
VAGLIDDTIDLHTFRADECADLVEEFVRAAHEAGHKRVRIIHGKGKGTLRALTHAVLARHPLVLRYALDETGNWGATIAVLA